MKLVKVTYAGKESGDKTHTTIIPRDKLSEFLACLSDTSYEDLGFGVSVTILGEIEDYYLEDYVRLK